MLGFDHELDGHLALEDFQRVLVKRAPESQTKRRASFVRYLAAISIGIVGTLASPLQSIQRVAKKLQKSGTLNRSPNHSLGTAPVSQSFNAR
jgi:hypothetical protein